MCRHWLENPLPDLGAKLRFLDPLTAVCTENLIRIYQVTESAKLAR